MSVQKDFFIVGYYIKRFKTLWTYIKKSCSYLYNNSVNYMSKTAD